MVKKQIKNIVNERYSNLKDFEGTLRYMNSADRDTDSIREFSELITLYPKSKYTLKAKENILIAKNQLAGQEVAVGRYYFKRNNPMSAIKRFKTVINEHKNTPYYPEAIFRSIEAYIMLGVNNKVLDYSEILKKDFPNSEWNILASNLKEEYGIKAD